MSVATLPSTWLALTTEALGWTLLHFLWQGVAAALALKVFFVLARRSSPQVRYLAGCATLALMSGAAMGTFVWQLGAEPHASRVLIAERTMALENDADFMRPSRRDVAEPVFGRERRGGSPHATGHSAAASSKPAEMPPTLPEGERRQGGLRLSEVMKSAPSLATECARRLEPWLPWIVGLWAIGVTFFSLRLLSSWQAVRGLRAEGRTGDAGDAIWFARFSQIKDRLGISYPVRLIVSSRAAVPMAIGWLAPVVLLPAGLLAGLSAAQIEAILAHELIHIRRHDYLVNLLQNMLETVFFYHPAVAWVSDRIRVEREHCCDDAASLVCGGTLEYARALAALAELRRAPALSVAATGGSLVDRIRRLASVSECDERRGLTPVAALLLPLTVASVALAILGAAVAQQRPAEISPKAAATKTPVQLNPTGLNSFGLNSAGRKTTGAKLAELGPAERKSKSADGIRLHGVVLRPDGRPAAGATVFSLRYVPTAEVNWKVLARTAADTDGKFEIVVPKKDELPDGFRGAGLGLITATAAGFGTQWTGLGGANFDPSEPLVLKLVPDRPIHGRIIDLEGKPIQGVAVRLLEISAPQAEGDLGPWLEAIRSGEMINDASRKVRRHLHGFDDPSQLPIKTDRDGRFTLSGVGSERVAHLELRGETIAYRQIDVVTRELKPISRVLWFSYGAARPAMKDQVFGADFTFQALPTKPVMGTVRDAETGKPLAGVTVESNQLAGVMVNPHNVLRTQTDMQGHYRLVGMPKQTGDGYADHNEIFVRPRDDQPYFFNRFTVPDSPGLAPVTFDIELHRGLWVTGRVTDKVTGKPVSAYVNYFPFRTNTWAAKLPEFNRKGVSVYEEILNPTRTDGTFRLVGLPGRAIVGVRALGRPYRKGVGASAIAGIAKNGEFATLPKLRPADAKWENALKEIDPASGTDSVRCDFALEAGGTIHVSVVDQAGHPVRECDTVGRSAAYTPEGHLGQHFDVEGLTPNESRRLMIVDRARKLGKVVNLKYDEKAPRAVTVTLEPCATIVGRIADADGVPVKGLAVTVSPPPGASRSVIPETVVCRPDGTFTCIGLMPGSDYALAVLGHGVGFQIPIAKIPIEPGKTIALGDIRLKPASD